MADSDKDSLYSSEEELAALGFFVPSGSSGESPASAPVPVPEAEDTTEHETEDETEDEPEPETEILHDRSETELIPAKGAEHQPQHEEELSEVDAAADEIVLNRQFQADPVADTEDLSMRDRAMSLVDHLSDLRKRLIISLVAFVVFLILSLFFISKTFEFLSKPLGAKLTVLGPAEIIHIYFMLGGLIALIPTLPFVMWQLWLFVAPGLTPKERKITSVYIPAVFLVFVGGISFGYFLVFPQLMRVLTGFSTQYTNYLPTADAYFSFMVRIMIPFGFIFEMPLIIMFLTRLGLINPIRLAKVRKYAYFVIVVISFMLTPPEITSHLSLTVPMILLYELSIQISKYAYKKRLKRQAMLDAEAAGQV